MEEEHICRVCRSEASEDNPLFHPCKCSGSIKYIHQDCLEQWLRHSQNKYCELCKHNFAFSPVYDESMPANLPSSVFLVGAIQKMIKFLRQLLRILLVLFCWGFVVPFATSHIWFLYFYPINGPDEGESTPIGTEAFNWDTFFQLDPRAIAASCLEGALISALVLITFFGLMVLRDYLVSQTILRAQVARPARQADPPILAEDDPLEHPFPDFRGWEDHVPHVPQPAPGPGLPENAPGHPVHNHHHHLDDDDDFDDDGEDDGDDSDMEDHQFLQPPVDIQQAVAAQRNQGAGAGAGAGGGFLDGPHDDLSFEELIGLKGPILNLFENVFWILLFNAVCLGSFVFLPYIIGNLVIKSGPEAFGELLKLANLDEKIANITLPSQLNFPVQVAESAIASPSVSTILGRLLSTLLGYVLLGLVVLLYLSLSGIFRANQLPLNRYIRRVALFFFTFFKVSLLLFVEIGAFPVICGWIFHLISLDLFGATLASHLSLFAASPISITFLHWFVGISYMFYFSSFVMVLREIFRPGIMWFVRNPNDPNFQPMKELIEQPLQKHLKRFFFSILFYDTALIILVYGSIKSAKFLFPTLFPLHLVWNDLLSEVSFDQLVLHVFLPITFQRVSPKDLVKRAIHSWLHGISRVLCLSSYLLGKDHPDEVIPGSVVMTVRNSDTEDPTTGLQATIEVNRPPHFPLRVATMLVALCFTSMIACLGVAFFPIVIGRSLFSLFVDREVHEIYTYLAGFCALWGLVVFGSWVSSALNSAEVLGRVLLRAGKALGKGLFLFVFFGVLIPLLLGILLEVTFMRPFLVSDSQCGYGFFIQDWTLGLLLVNLFHHCITQGPDTRTKAELAEWFRHGLSELPVGKIWRLLAFPLIATLLFGLFAPMALSYVLLRLFGVNLQWMTHLLVPLVPLAVLSARLIVNWFRAVQVTIRNERYLVGQRLHNLE